MFWHWYLVIIHKQNVIKMKWNLVHYFFIPLNYTFHLHRSSSVADINVFPSPNIYFPGIDNMFVLK